jgi:gamma-glutamyl phosphate reductase
LESWSTVSVCVPAGRVTLAVTVAQVSYPPVFGTATGPVRLAPDELAMCSASVTP